MLSRSDSGLWLGVLGLFLVCMVAIFMRETDLLLVRAVLDVVVLLAPIGAVFVGSQKRVNWRDWIGTVPDALTFALTGIASIAVWVISWWLMDMAGTTLLEKVGLYFPQPALFKYWSLEVIFAVVLIPLALSFFIFGMLRAALQNVNHIIAVLLMACLAASMTVLIVPHLSQHLVSGLPGFVGYFLIGLVASFLSLQTHSMWIGLTAYSTYFYTHFALQEKMLEQFFNVDYFSTDWLALLMVCAFITVVILQVSRIRHPAEQHSEKKTTRKEENRITGAGWAAVVMIILILSLLAVAELRARNENRVQASRLYGKVTDML